MSFVIEYQQTDFYVVYGWILDDGVKKIGTVHVNGKGFGSELEKIVESSGAKAPKAKDPNNNYGRRKDIVDFLDKTNEDRVIEVDSLGTGILGMYDPSTDRVYVVKGLEPSIKSWVKEHEWAHRLMQYLGIKQSERLADWIATKKMGFNPFPGRLENNNLYRIISREIADYTNRYRRRTNILQMPQKRATYKTLEELDIRYGKVA